MENSDIKNIAVDLDGTLIKTDVLFEGVVNIIKRNPFLVFLMMLWLFKGKSFFKYKVAVNSNINFDLLPQNDSVVEYLTTMKNNGYRLILITGSAKIYAEKAAERFGFFDLFFGSEIDNNLIGIMKTRLLDSTFGVGNYFYIGDSKTDIPVFNSSAKAIVVNTKKSIIKRINVPIHLLSNDNTSFLKNLIKQMRVSQWIKNLLIFLPLILSHKYGDLTHWINSIIAFFSFSILTSIVYIINDCFDLESDRRHKLKFKRPLASGLIDFSIALKLLGILTILYLSSIYFIPTISLIFMLLYFFITMLYTIILKKVPLLDIIILSCLFTFRIVIGASASDIYISHWLYLFAPFFFISLAAMKRYAELSELSINESTFGRGYNGRHAPIIAAKGVTAGFISVIILLLYSLSFEARQLYKEPSIMFIVSGIIAFWLIRMWYKTKRGEISQDPVNFAIKDKVSWISAISIFIIIFMDAL